MTPFPTEAVDSLPGCDIDCCDSGEGTCPCGSGVHDAWNTTPSFWFWTRNGGVHAYQGDCREYTCDVRHGPYCPYPGGEPLTPEYLEQLRIAVASQNAKVLSGLLAGRREIATNVERSALQIENCKGRTVMHMPLPDEFAKAVHSTLRASSH